MSKGVIVQFENNKALVLKNDGSFISCPRNQSWQVGDVIGLPNQKPRFLSMRTALVSFATAFVLFGGLSFVVYQAPVTIIELSVNPSVQITVNRFDRVLHVNGLNLAGENLIQGMPYRNHSLTEVYHRVMSRLANNSYLNDGAIQFAVANDSFVSFLSIEEHLREVFEQYFQNDAVIVSIMRFDLNEYNALAHPIPIVTIPDEPATQLDNAEPMPQRQGGTNQNPQRQNRHQQGNWDNGWWRWDCCD